jgi:hypothetical protein
MRERLTRTREGNGIVYLDKNMGKPGYTLAKAVAIAMTDKTPFGNGSYITSTTASNIITSNAQPRSAPTHPHLFLSSHPHPSPYYSLPMHSVSDLTTFSRKTSGDVPPKLVVRTLTADVASLLPFSFLLCRVHPPQ